MNKFDKDGFLTYLKVSFSAMDSHFTYDMMSNLIDYAMENKSGAKDSLCEFLSNIIDDISFAEVALFETDENLTDAGLAKKREMQAKLQTAYKENQS